MVGGLGRWFSRDPIEENGGVNLFAYVSNSLRSDSVRQSKKQGTFIRLIPVSPENFLWEGHDVRIQESWLETFPDGKVTSLTFSDKGMKESSLRGRYLCFLNEDKTVEEKYAPLDFTTRGFANYFFGGRSGKVVHFMRMKDPIPS